MNSFVRRITSPSAHAHSATSRKEARQMRSQSAADAAGTSIGQPPASLSRMRFAELHLSGVPAPSTTARSGHRCRNALDAPNISCIASVIQSSWECTKSKHRTEKHKHRFTLKQRERYKHQKKGIDFVSVRLTNWHATWTAQIRSVGFCMSESIKYHCSLLPLPYQFFSLLLSYDE